MIIKQLIARNANAMFIHVYAINENPHQCSLTNRFEENGNIVIEMHSDLHKSIKKYSKCYLIWDLSLSYKIFE